MTTKPQNKPQNKPQPKRIKMPTRPKEPKVSSSEDFELPQFELNLEFFLNKGDEDFTEETLVEKALGDIGKRLTPAEQVYVILDALKDLEVVAPLELECEHCGTVNPVAIELAKVMKVEGESKSKFYIDYGDYTFEFVRPEEVHDTSKVSSSVASLGMFMLQWLNAHNQGPDFDILKMKLSEFLELAKLFGEQMLGVSFESKISCSKCSKNIQEEFSVTMEDLVSILNDM